MDCVRSKPGDGGTAAWRRGRSLASQEDMSARLGPLTTSAPESSYSFISLFIWLPKVITFFAQPFSHSRQISQSVNKERINSKITIETISLVCERSGLRNLCLDFPPNHNLVSLFLPFFVSQKFGKLSLSSTLFRNRALFQHHLGT